MADEEKPLVLDYADDLVRLFQSAGHKQPIVNGRARTESPSDLRSALPKCKMLLQHFNSSDLDIGVVLLDCHNYEDIRQNINTRRCITQCGI